MKKVLKSVISLAISATMIIASANLAFADPVRSVEVKTYVGENEVSTVFVGEQIKTDISLKNFESISAYDFVLRYNNSVVQLYDKTLSAEISEDGEFTTSGAVTVNDGLQLETPVTDFVLPSLGVLLSAQSQSDAVSVGSNTLFASANFIVKAAGDASLRFASTNADYDYIFDNIGMDLEAANPSAVNLTDDSGSLAFTVVPNSVTALAAPGPAESLAWAEDNYNVSWEEPSTGCRGYILKLWKKVAEENYEQVGTDIEVSDTSYDLAPVITAPGTYKFTVIAKGGTNNSTEATSTDKEVSAIPMTSTAASYDGTTDTLSWTAVEHSSGYKITVYQGEDKIIDESVGAVTSYSNLLGERVGIFDIKVEAVPADEMHAAYAETARTYDTGATITGTLKFGISETEMVEEEEVTTVVFGLSNRMANRVASNFMPYVTLTNVDNEEATYSAKANAEGVFNIRKVPAGTYTVTIHGTSVVPRPVQNSEGNDLVVTVSETTTINIAKASGMGVLIGDLDNNSAININDVTRLINVFGLKAGDSGFNPDYDFIGGDGNSISAQELQCLIALFNKGPKNYRALSDNNLTVQVKSGLI